MSSNECIGTLEELIDKIKIEIEKNMDQGKKNIYNIREIVNKYDGEDWKEYLEYCEEKYKRNRVYIDENIEILVICWDIGQSSKIHDHPENGCIVKLLKGDLRENIYRGKEGEFKCIKERNMSEKNTTYLQGEYGLHNVENINNERAATLHIYSPPNYKPKYY